MNAAIWVLMVQASLGAFDTLYYHEYRLKLAHATHTGVELRLHAARDFAYAIRLPINFFIGEPDQLLNSTASI